MCHATAVCVGVTSALSPSLPRDQEPAENARQRVRVYRESARKAWRQRQMHRQPLQDAFCVGIEPSGLIQACQRAQKRPNWYCRLPRRGEGTVEYNFTPSLFCLGVCLLCLAFHSMKLPCSFVSVSNGLVRSGDLALELLVNVCSVALCCFWCPVF